MLKSLMNSVQCMIFILLSGLVSAEVILTPPIANSNDQYCLDMLRLALSYSEKKFTIETQSLPEKTLPRVISELESGQLSVMWTASDKNKEQQLLPVRIPLFKGMFGYRVFIINRHNQSKFDRLKTLDVLRNEISFGQGRTWADTEILKSANLNVVTTMKFSGLMHMVEAGRFDAFPRGIHEPWSELTAFSGLELAVEKNILLVYKMPFYFFVANSNKQLHMAIERGLNQAIADGSFDKLFFGNEAVKNALANANLKGRRIFEIANPNLSVETPVDRSELWLDVSRL